MTHGLACFSQALAQVLADLGDLGDLGDAEAGVPRHHVGRPGVSGRLGKAVAASHHPCEPQAGASAARAR